MGICRNYVKIISINWAIIKKFNLKFLKFLKFEASKINKILNF